MAYTFRIHKDTPGNEDGWKQTVELTEGTDNNSGVNGIPDLIEGGTNSGKIGTSIPTPFARVYLFETAFKFVSSNRNHQPNFYDQLVSQSLDLIQLLFEKGKDKKLKLYNWNGKSQLEHISRKGITEGHKTLAEAFNMGITAKPVLSNLIIVEYEGVILGGSSPFTLCYTSPNAARILMEKNIELYSNDKRPLFRNKITHLKDRSIEFQKYIDWLVNAHIREFTGTGSTLSSFYNYYKSQNLYLSDDVKSTAKEEYYPVLRKSNNFQQDVSFNVTGQLSLRYNDEPINMSQSDFLMRPSINCYGSNALIPIILPTDGDSNYDGWKYTDKEAWKSYTTYDYWRIKDVDVNDRYLVMNGANSQDTTNKYPWLTAGDFFEDCLIDLGFSLNGERFYSPCGDKPFPFLVPIRKEYFKYFTLEDLKDNLSCEVRYDSRGKLEGVEFQLRVKLQNRDSIILRRKYVPARNATETQYAIRKFNGGFSFGVYPFYRCKDDEDIKNEYSIYLYSLPEDDATYQPTLTFFKQNFISNSIQTISDPAGENGVVRTTDDRQSIGTSRVINLRNENTNSFDLIEVKVVDRDKEGYGLALPLWITPKRPDSNKKSYVSIDFGTSNTYVSYVEDKEAKPLAFGIDDQQMVLLNSPLTKPGTSKKQFKNANSFGRALYMDQFLREFVPSVLGDKRIVDESEFIDFPIKTATLEKVNFTADDELFSGINIGFNIDNEKSAVDNDHFIYQTNLKWAAEDHKANGNLGEANKAAKRVQAFCDQILWMVKNKLIILGYSTDDMKMIYFYPDSMSENGRKIFKDSWAKSVDRIFNKRGFRVAIEEDLEAISPYYSLTVLHSNDVASKSLANIDVGGGTTDYFIFDQKHFSQSSTSVETGKAYEASIFFAGNDLWGATYPASLNNLNQQNGFVSYMKSKIGDTPKEAQDLYTAFGDKRSMTDYTGFFFKNNDLFQFSDLIANHTKFKYVLFMHYASLIYNFADMLKKIKSKNPDFNYPEVLTFTGKGSEYIKMISDDKAVISRITTDLLKAFDVPGFVSLKVLNFDNPKALTADGGLYKLMSHQSLQVNLVDTNWFGLSESSSVVNTPFERIGDKCLGFDMDENVQYSMGQVTSLKSKVLDNVKNFVSIVHNSSILAPTRQYLRLNLNQDDFDTFIKLAAESYDVYANRSNKINKDTLAHDLKDNLFFYAMKNTLISLSIKYAEQ